VDLTFVRTPLVAVAEGGDESAEKDEPGAALIKKPGGLMRVFVGVERMVFC
jgi:hypothetical protein